MKTVYTLILFVVLAAFTRSGTKFFKIPEKWPATEYDFTKNPLEENKIIIGRALFYDPILSHDSSIACVNCHSPYNAFTHVDHNLSHGIHDSIGTRNSPALMNLAWYKNFMWDGAIHHLDQQALAPISHPAEMGSTIAEVVKKLNQSVLYKRIFLQTYGDSAITGERTLKCISQFMLTLVSANSTYDKVMRGELEFTEQQEKGYSLFKSNCSACHSEPLFTNQEMENNGIGFDPVLNDKGRMNITGNRNDSLKFKVPTLRNIEYTFPYMHDGRFKNLSEVLNHYTTCTNEYTSKKLNLPISLSKNDKTDLIAFLLTLTDREFLFNKEFSYPKEIFQHLNAGK